MAAVSKKPTVPKAGGLPHKTGELRCIGGSVADAFNQTLADQVVRSLWLANAKEDERDRLHMAALATLISIAPKDEIEGMLAGQMVAAHAASMECYRRAMIGSQGHEGPTVEPEPRRQAVPDLCAALGGTQPAPGQNGPAEGHGRARARARGRASYRRRG
jgi:hypothetical protein